MRVAYIDYEPRYEPRPLGSGRSRNRSLTVAARGGFTLIEMLIVIAIMLMLAAMMMAVSPGVSTRQQAYRGAAQLQTQLAYGRNRAKMNMLPTGVLVTSSPPGLPQATNIQIIQSAGDYAAGLALSPPGNPPPLNMVQLTQTLPPGFFQPGDVDFLEMAGSGLPHLIMAAGGNTLMLGSPLPTIYAQPVSYRIMRSPRQLVGEEPVQLPNDVAIDLVNSRAFTGGQMVNFPNPSEVLFSPSGALTGLSSGYDIVCFMVRDISLPYPQGFPTIIAVYGKTGFITAHPVNINPNVGGGNPFWFALNARSSGM